MNQRAVLTPTEVLILRTSYEYALAETPPLLLLPIILTIDIHTHHSYHTKHCICDAVYLLTHKVTRECTLRQYGTTIIILFCTHATITVV